MIDTDTDTDIDTDTDTETSTTASLDAGDCDALSGAMGREENLDPAGVLNPGKPLIEAE